jgi:hypothetical protein
MLHTLQADDFLWTVMLRSHSPLASSKLARCTDWSAPLRASSEEGLLSYPVTSPITFSNIEVLVALQLSLIHL